MGHLGHEDGYWRSADGLRLHYRAWGKDGAGPPLLCLPGLTRNARDFEPVAEAFSGTRRVIACNLRGRGDSDYARDAATYEPGTYVADVVALLDELGIGRAIILGTSLGGIVAMLMALSHGERIAGVVLNDIGPEIAPEGLARIRDQVGQGGTYPTWMHAARALKESSGPLYPGFELADWLRLAKRQLCITGNGRIAFDYDMKIAEPLAAAAATPPVDLWEAFMALRGRPVLVLRGALSDILTAATLARMAQRLPGLEQVTVPGVGHPPTLEEVQSREAIARLIERCAEPARA